MLCLSSLSLECKVALTRIKLRPQQCTINVFIQAQIALQRHHNEYVILLCLSSLSLQHKVVLMRIKLGPSLIR